jgi:hypothetical protein
MAGDDDPQDDGERTRIGGLPPGVPKPPSAPAPASPAAPASSSSPAAPAADEPSERTVLAPARPPGAPAAPGAAPAAPKPAPPASGGDDERTRVVTGAPPRPAGAAAPPAPAAAAPAAAEGGDRTRVIASPPPGAARQAPAVAPAPAGPAPAAPAAAAPPPAAPAPAAPSAPPTGTVMAPPAAAAVGDATVTPGRAAAGDDDDRTVVLARKAESTVRLERVAPSGSDEVIALDRPSIVLGRGHGCDVKLRTPTASREHARIFFKDGQWMIAGVEGRTFSVDGKRSASGETRLQGGMRLKLGDDEFVVVDSTAGTVASRGGGGLWARIASFVRGLFGRRS